MPPGPGISFDKWAVIFHFENLGVKFGPTRAQEEGPTGPKRMTNKSPREGPNKGLREGPIRPKGGAHKGPKEGPTRA